MVYGAWGIPIWLCKGILHIFRRPLFIRGYASMNRSRLSSLFIGSTSAMVQSVYKCENLLLLF